MLTKLSPTQLLDNLLNFLQKFKQQRIRTFSVLFAVGISLTLAVSACSPDQNANSQLSPADARVVFENKKVDAWAIWDPYLAAAEKATNARTLTSATGLAPNRGYYLAAKSFVEKNPEGLKTVLDEVKKTSDQKLSSAPKQIVLRETPNAVFNFADSK